MLPCDWIYILSRFIPLSFIINIFHAKKMGGISRCLKRNLLLTKTGRYNRSMEGSQEKGLIFAWSAVHISKIFLAIIWKPLLTYCKRGYDLNYQRVKLDNFTVRASAHRQPIFEKELHSELTSCLVVNLHFVFRFRLYIGRQC